jgi:hypothetical protein
VAKPVFKEILVLVVTSDSEDLDIVAVETFDTSSSGEFCAKPKEEISIPHKNKQYFIFIMVGERANITKLTTYQRKCPGSYPRASCKYQIK